jgi:lysyl-tRNA synthetase class 2
VSGFIYKTKRGEVSVWARDFMILTKSLRPLPSEWFGLKDKEAKYRQRYVDLVLSQETRETFRKRAAIIQAFREFFISRGYIEVETPILQPIYGGTNARPFESKLNALDMKVYMRISNELYLKRLLVGGYEKIFEFSQDFRNEGIDKTHNPEFLLMETMWAYADYRDNMDLTEELLEFITKKVLGTTKVQYGSNVIDFRRPWTRITMLDAIKKHTGMDFDLPPAKAAQLAEKIGVEVKKDMTWGMIVNKVFEEKVEHHLIQPTIVYDFPSETAPLAKKREDEPRFSERFEPYANGWELGNSYSELNDPRVLRANWDAQEKALKKGDEEAQRMDTDFLRALEYGMPPASGLGIGMDRVIILLTNSESIRDVILFPFMRPEDTEEPLAPVKVPEHKKHHHVPAQKPMDKALHEFEKAAKPAHHGKVEKPHLKRLNL